MSESDNQMLQEILDTMRAMKEDVVRLNTAVIGDEKAGVSGLALRMSDNEKKTEDALTYVKSFRLVGSTIGVIWGVVIALIAIFKHKIS